MKQAIGIDIGGTNLRIGCVDSYGNLTNFERVSSRNLMNAGAVHVLGEYISEYIDRYSLYDKIAAVGIGVPSAVSKDKSFVYSTPNLKGLENMDLGNILTDKLKIQVYVERDVNYLLWNDINKYRLNQGNKNTILGFYLGTGLGNALCIQGNMYTGKNGVAGELGHAPFWGLHEKCSCGNEGCIELRCSGYHLDEIRKRWFPQTDIGDIFTLHGDEQVIRDYIDTLSYPIALEITVFDPDYVVMSGGVMRMKDFPAKRLTELIKQRVRHPYPSENLEFVFPESSQTDGVIGGGLSVWEILKSRKNA